MYYGYIEITHSCQGGLFFYKLSCACSRNVLTFFKLLIQDQRKQNKKAVVFPFAPTCIPLYRCCVCYLHFLCVHTSALIWPGSLCFGVVRSCRGSNRPLRQAYKQMLIFSLNNRSSGCRSATKLVEIASTLPLFYFQLTVSRCFGGVNPGHQ